MELLPVEEEEGMNTDTGKLPIPSSSSPPYYDSSNHQRPPLGTSFDDQSEDPDDTRSYGRAAAIELMIGGAEVESSTGFIMKYKKLESIGLTPRRSNEESDDSGAAGGGGGAGWCVKREREKEHMFDKVVTPSDVGKLNRLVIPKQHAEKYFPLDSSANEKGLLLNFEDRSGKPWRFRYSYWTSSQSYVMTKGWSRFVKDKKLDAGDIVAFQRGAGESGKDRLYIDWRHRPHDRASLSHDHHHHHLQMQPGGKLYSLQLPAASLPRDQHHRLQQLNYGGIIQQRPPCPDHHHHHERAGGSYSNDAHDHNAISSLNYNNIIRRTASYHQIGAVAGAARQGGCWGNIPMVINSMPAVHSNNIAAAAAAPKRRLRLFGVNMEEEYCPCPTPTVPDESQSPILPSVPYVTTMPSLSTPFHHCLHSFSSSPPPPQLRLYDGVPESFPKKRQTSLSFDLDL